MHNDAPCLQLLAWMSALLSRTFKQNRVLGAEDAGNRKRDRRVTRQLRAKGWSVIRVWECSLRKRPEATVAGLLRSLEKRRDGA